MHNITYTIDYVKNVLYLNYYGEEFFFDLNNGDAGDFWYAFTASDGVVRDVNLYQEDEDMSPNLYIYGVKHGCTDIDDYDDSAVLIN